MVPNTYVGLAMSPDGRSFANAQNVRRACWSATASLLMLDAKILLRRASGSNMGLHLGWVRLGCHGGGVCKAET
jgi:hypothetical protein